MSKMQDTEKRRMNVLRFGLMVIPPVAWAVAFAYPFLIANAFGQDWIGLALIPSLVVAVVVGIVCAAVWFAYKRLVFKQA